MSMQEDLRRILKQTVADEDSAGEMMVRIFSRSSEDENVELPAPEADGERLKFRGEE